MVKHALKLTHAPGIEVVAPICVKMLVAGPFVVAIPDINFPGIVELVKISTSVALIILVLMCATILPDRMHACVIFPFSLEMMVDHVSELKWK